MCCRAWTVVIEVDDSLRKDCAERAVPLLCALCFEASPISHCKAGVCVFLMRHTLILFAVYLQSVAFPGSAAGGEHFTVSDLIRGAEQASKQINTMELCWKTTTFHGTYPKGTAVHEVSSNKATKVLIETQTSQMSMLRGGHIKTESLSSNDGSEVRCTNPAYTFILRRHPPLDRWTIHYCEQNGISSLHDNEVSLVSHGLKGSLLSTHYINLLPLSEFLRKPGVDFKIGNPEPTDRGRVRVEFIDSNPPVSLHGWSRGQFYCDPRNQWAIDEAQGFIENVNGTGSTVKCSRVSEFENTTNRFPTVRTLKYLFQNDVNGQQACWGSIMEFEIADSTALPEEFYLSAYGFPEPRFDRERFPGAWFWYLLASAGCVIVFLIIRRRYHAN